MGEKTVTYKIPIFKQDGYNIKTETLRTCDICGDVDGEERILESSIFGKMHSKRHIHLRNCSNCGKEICQECVREQCDIWDINNDHYGTINICKECNGQFKTPLVNNILDLLEQKDALEKKIGKITEEIMSKYDELKKKT